MIPIQEIHIYVGSNSRVTGHIICQSQGSKSIYTAELFIYNPAASSTLKALGTFHSSGDAFDALISRALKYAKRTNQQIIRINNPCNCEFVCKKVQQVAVDERGIKVEVEVNA